MSKHGTDWIPDGVDLDWIESLSQPLAGGAGRHRGGRRSRTRSRSSTATPGASCRCSPAVARRIVEVGTAYGYSTLWMALGQPADGTIVTIDPDRERTDLARGWWREAGIADERITVVNAPALDALAAATRRWPARSTWPSSTRSSPSTRATSTRSPTASPRARSSSPTTSCGAAGPRGPVRSPTVTRTPPRSGRSMPPSWPTRGFDRDDPAGRRRPAHRHVARLTDTDRAVAMPIHVRVRLFAVQRELAGTREVPLELPDGADVEAAWAALVARHPVLAPGRASLRFARNGDYAEPTDGARRRRRGGDDPAGVGWCRDHGAGRRPTPGSSRSATSRSRAPSWPSWPTRWPSPRTARSSGSSAGRARRPGRPLRARRPRRRATRAARWSRSSTRRTRRWRSRTLATIADEIAVRFGVDRLAIVHRTGEVPLGEASIAVVAVAPHRDAAFDAARYAIDETKARAPIWKAERFADGHVWIGHQARTGTGRRAR